MDMQGSRTLAVTQQQTWDALNDPAVLKAAIPGCERLEHSGENQFAVLVAVKIGPVAAKFNGHVQLSDIHPPNDYRIAFEGQGGPAGFGKGQSQVRLSPAADGVGCELNYSVQAQVGGKIAQMGQRLIDGVAKSMAEDFFKRFDAEMQRLHPEAYAARAAAASAQAQAPVAASVQAAAPAPTRSGAATWMWVAAAAVVLALLLWWMQR